MNITKLLLCLLCGTIYFKIEQFLDILMWMKLIIGTALTTLPSKMLERCEVHNLCITILFYLAYYYYQCKFITKTRHKCFGKTCKPFVNYGYTSESFKIYVQLLTSEVNLPGTMVHSLLRLLAFFVCFLSFIIVSRFPLFIRITQTTGRSFSDTKSNEVHIPPKAETLPKSDCILDVRFH